jgi:class 3 adenylate cyclase
MSELKEQDDWSAGERKHVTVLFADISDSLAMIQDSDPEDARAIFDRTIGAVTQVIRRHGGTTNRFLGDGVMALFGAPVAQERHAVNATAAALDILRTVEELNPILESAHGVRIRMHLGLDSGEVVVRSVSTDVHTEYDAVGRTVHVAARLQALSPPNAVRISAETARQVAGFITARSHGMIAVKGLVEPLEIFEPVDSVGASTPFELSVSRGLSPFVGRDREISSLLEAASRVEAQGGELWAIVGEPGTGKSRLVHEIGVKLQASGWLIVEASCMHSASANLAPIATLLRSFFGIGDAHSEDAIRQVIFRGRPTGSLESHAAAALLSIFGLASGDRDWNGLDAPLRRDAVRNALADLLTSAADEQPIAVVVQDLQWASDDTILLLDRLVQRLSSARVLFLVNFRPECRNPWRGDRRTQELSIDSLPFHDARALIEALLGADPSLAEIQHLLLNRSAGNPFFIEECVRSLAESGALVVEGERSD